MSGPTFNQVQVLLIKAAQDEAVLHGSGSSDEILGFHAQQAVEKLMKALLSQVGIVFERTHVLGRLETALIAAGESSPVCPLPLSQLNEFAVNYRYDYLPETVCPSRKELIETVGLWRDHVYARVTALSGSAETVEAVTSL
jgi:hypothetical protein